MSPAAPGLPRLVAMAIRGGWTPQPRIWVPATFPVASRRWRWPAPIPAEGLCTRGQWRRYWNWLGHQVRHCVRSRRRR